MADMNKFNDELAKAGALPRRASPLLQRSPHPLLRQEPHRHHGPFAETKELVAAFRLWQVKSLEEAIEWVKRCPSPHAGDSDIEIRQVFEPEDFAPAFSEEDIQQEKDFRAQLTDKVAKK
jgi:hypothetical protein